MSRKSSQNTITLKNNDIILSQDSTLENLAGQMQKNSDKLLCVINGKILRFYEKTHHFPSTTFSRKHDVNDSIEYYFIDSINHYCVFGDEMAQIFNPNYKISNNNNVRKKKKDKMCSFSSQLAGKNEDNRKLCRKLPKDVEKERKKLMDKTVIISDSGKTLYFPYKESKIEIVEYEI